MPWGMAAAAGASALASYYSSKQGGGQGSKQSTRLPGWLSNQSQRTASNARSALEGDFFADPTEAQRQGWESQLGFAQGLEGPEGGQFGQSAVDLGQQTLQGDFLHPESNPYLQANIEAAQEPVVQRFQRDIMPQVTANATGAGQMGSSRQGVIEANAMNDLNRNLSDMASRMIAENYARERQAQMQAPQLLQQGVQLGTVPGQIQQQIGERQRQFEERELQEDFLKEQRMAQLLAGLQHGSTTTQTQMRDPIMQALQGGVGGAQLYNLFTEDGD